MFTPVHWLAFTGIAAMVGLMSATSDKDTKKSTGYLYSVFFLEIIGLGVAIDGQESTFVTWGLLSLSVTGLEIWWRKRNMPKAEEISN